MAAQKDMASYAIIHYSDAEMNSGGSPGYVSVSAGSIC